MNIFRRPFLGISKKAKRGVGDDVREVVRSVVAAVLDPAAVDVEGVVVEARVALQPEPLVPPGGHVLARVLVQVLAEVACGGLREKVDRRMKGRPRKFWCSGASPRSLFEVLKAGSRLRGGGLSRLSRCQKSSSFIKFVPLITVIEYIMSNNFLNLMEACLINSEIRTYVVQIVALTQEFL